MQIYHIRPGYIFKPLKYLPYVCHELHQLIMHRFAFTRTLRMSHIEYNITSNKWKHAPYDFLIVRKWKYHGI